MQIGPDRPSGGRAKLVIVGALAGVLVVGSLVTAAYALGSRAATNRAVNVLIGAGVMTPFPDGFRADAPATRGTVALALHRSIPRIAVQEDLDNLGASSGLTDIGDVVFRIDGAPHKQQGVLISVQMQLDHDNGFGSGCLATFELTRNHSSVDLGRWEQEYYAGASGEEKNVSFSFFLLQSTNTTATYHLLASNTCTQTLFTDEEIMTAQSFPLTGGGGVFKPISIAKRGNLVARHDA